MVTLLFIYLFFLLAFSLLSPLKNEKIYFGIFCFFLFLFAAYRPPFEDRDYSSYYYAFRDGSSSLESSFIIISKIIKLFFGNNPSILFLVYAMLGVGLKAYSIQKTSNLLILSLYLYFCYLFSLQELTGIRTGVATGFIFLAIHPYCSGKISKAFICYLCACFFHISAAVLIILFFLKRDKLNKYFWGALIPMAYILHISGGNLLNLDILQPLVMSDRLESKINSYTQDAVLNVYNAWQLLRIFFAFYFLTVIDSLQNKNQHAIIAFKLYVISICILPILGNLPTFANRLSDIFMISDIILIPMLVYLYTPKIIPKLLVLTYGALYFFMNIFYNKIFFE